MIILPRRNFPSAPSQFSSPKSIVIVRESSLNTREIFTHSDKRKELLKHMILQLHKGEAPESVKKQLTRLLGEVPYDDVVIVEQELIEEGLPIEDVLKLCDIHTAALKGKISHEGAKTAPVGHPIHTFKEENRELSWKILC